MPLELQKLNSVRDAFLSLSTESLVERRRWLLLTGDEVSNLSDLLQAYVWDFGVLEGEILSFKVWFALSYQELGHMLGRSSREVSQILRQTRVAQLETYPPVSRAFESNQLGGLSCFMVEQYLSAWVDNELQDPSIKEQMEIHLTHCQPCSLRLTAYRNLQSQILSLRKVFPALTEEERSHLRALEKKQERKILAKVVAIVFVVMTLTAVGVWRIFSGSGKMPNVYEMGSE